MDKRELRAPKKKKFQLEYATAQNVLEELTREEMGEYYEAIVNYELYGIEPESFSDRVVHSLFHRTVTELDFQLDKHYQRVEQGTINQQGGKKKATQLMEVLSADDKEKLEKKYQCWDMLIEEIQKQLDANNTVLQYPRRYVEKYANDSNWNQRIEDEINEVSGVGSANCY